MICKCEQCTKFVDGNCTALKYIQISNGKCINFAPDNISTLQHRYYRGLLLPALAEALGENNNQYVHDFILKPEFYYRLTGDYYIKVSRYDDIPAKYQGSARIISEFDYLTERNTKIIGYIPSMAEYTKKDTKDYFKFCETMLEEIGGQIPTDQNQEYRQLREKVLK